MILARRDNDGTGNDGRMATVVCSPGKRLGRQRNLPGGAGVPGGAGRHHL